MWRADPLEKTLMVGKIEGGRRRKRMRWLSLLLNMLPRLVITFLPRSKRLLISWLQSPSAVILEPPKIKSDSGTLPQTNSIDAKRHLGSRQPARTARLSPTSREASCPQSSKHLLSLSFVLDGEIPPSKNASENVPRCVIKCHHEWTIGESTEH